MTTPTDRMFIIHSTERWNANYRDICYLMNVVMKFKAFTCPNSDRNLWNSALSLSLSFYCSNSNRRDPSIHSIITYRKLSQWFANSNLKNRPTNCWFQKCASERSTGTCVCGSKLNNVELWLTTMLATPYASHITPMQFHGMHISTRCKSNVITTET